MFNHKAKKQALRYLKQTQESYEEWIYKITQKAQDLFDQRVATA